MLDQHFMIDNELIKRIVDALEIKPDENVLEIGGGKGALTQELVKKTKKITVIELDASLSRFLRQRFPGVKIEYRNALEGDKFEYEKIIGNLPYSICEPFMKKLLKSKFKMAILTVPKSFLSDGLLKRIMRLFFRVKTLEFVHSSAFSPQPKTESKVIVVVPKKLRQKAQVVKEVYVQKDKVLKNALREAYCKAYNMTKKESLKHLPEIKFLNKKVYTLSANEWIDLLESMDIRG